VPDIIPRVDGESCSAAEACVATVTCSSANICVGVKATIACQTADQCTVGNSCIQNVCAPQIKDTTSACVSDYDCINTMGCTTDTKKCMAYNSLTTTSKTTSATFCKSGLALPDSTGQLYCIDLQIVDALKTFECPAGSTTATDCTYNITGLPTPTTTTRKCTCSYGVADKVYCPADTLSSKFSGAWANQIASRTAAMGNASLHTVRRMSAQSKHDSDYLLLQFPLYEKTDDCVNQIGLSAGWLQIGATLLAMILFI